MSNSPPAPTCDDVAGPEVRNGPRSNWRIRRRLIFLTVFFCMALIAYVVWRDSDTKLMDTALTMAFITLGSVIGSYVFGATYEDVSVTRMKTGSSPSS